MDLQKKTLILRPLIQVNLDEPAPKVYNLYSAVCIAISISVAAVPLVFTLHVPFFVKQ